MIDHSVPCVPPFEYAQGPWLSGFSNQISIIDCVPLSQLSCLAIDLLNIAWTGTQIVISQLLVK